MTTPLPQARFKRVNESLILIETEGVTDLGNRVFRQYEVRLQPAGRVTLDLVGAQGYPPADWPKAA